MLDAPTNRVGRRVKTGAKSGVLDLRLEGSEPKAKAQKISKCLGLVGLRYGLAQYNHKLRFPNRK